MAEKEFGEKLKEVRIKKGDTQSDLGSLLGVGIKQIQRYENGDVLPDHDKVKKLQEIYKCDFVSLIYDVPRGVKNEGTDKYQVKYMELLEKENDQKAQIINVNLTGLMVGQKSILAHLAVSLEQDALRDAKGDKKKAAQLKDNMDKRIVEVMVSTEKKHMNSGT